MEEMTSEPSCERLDWFRQEPERSDPYRLDADPVRTVWQLPRFRLGGRRFTGRIDHALVCVTRKGVYDTFLPPDRPTSVRRYVALYEVDTGPHTFRLRVPLPSLVDSFEFEATADVTWRVAVAERFVQSKERDVPGLITRALLPVMRAASRRHPIEASAGAEQSVQRAVGASDIGSEQGLRVDWAIRLRRDAAERSHQTRLRTARHEAEAVQPEHEASLLRQRLEATRHSERITLYAEQLAKGGIAALALHLAAHPDDTSLVLTHLSQEQAQLVQNQLHLIDQALEKNRLEDYQMEVPHQLIAERMAALLRTTAPGHAPETPAETPSRPLPKGWPEPDA
ncbi:hypothetical protein L0F81_06080 [Streptomyces tricolor]|uniref:PE-PGRS family protein n=1 Tax=Streptomyces tricolor TaxID=68277 RepID=A0ABS9JBC1_9ACTN|nr:hypothetical protein [Streptomyces tricolor]MCG0062861.1 hypothetical protein [Streptomyces tricolor]